MRIIGQRIGCVFSDCAHCGCIVSSAAAQTTTYSAVTETQDSTWNRSTRVQETHVDANGRIIETQVVERPSINGGYALGTATEKETIHDEP